MIIVILLPACFLKGPIDLFLHFIHRFYLIPIVTMRFVIVIINEHDDYNDDGDELRFWFFYVANNTSITYKRLVHISLIIGSRQPIVAVYCTG